jgi:hypothetical protein
VDRGDPALLRRAVGKFTLRLSQKQQAAIGRLVAAGKIDGEFLVSDRWQIERKRRIVSHRAVAQG